jgi:hypothetical protein
MGNEKYVRAISDRVARGSKGEEGWFGRLYGRKGEGWGVDPDTANKVRAHLRKKKDGGSRARLRSKSKSKSKRMKRKCTTLKRKSHK